MRLSTSAAFFVAVICSWAVLDVLACKNDNNMFIFKRTKADRVPQNSGSRFQPYNRPASQTSNEWQDLPAWLSMKVANPLFSPNAMVMITNGKYLHHENPVVKVYKLKNEKDILMVYAEVSNLKQVKQYIDGGILRFKDKRVALLLMENQGRALANEDRRMYDMWGGPSRATYLAKYHMRHLDPFIQNYAYVPNKRLLNILDWGFASYKDVPVPSKHTVQVIHRSVGLPLPPPPTPEDIKPINDDPDFSSIEDEIREGEPVRLWGNEEANYYKFKGPTALKVSWVDGIRQYQSFMIELSNEIKVDCFEAAGILKVGETKWISYLIIKFPGEMEKPNMEPDLKKDLQKAAILRYKMKYGMINLRARDEYFIYNLEKKEAYIYDWSSARHEDLPDGTLQNFRWLTRDSVNNLKSKANTCMATLLANSYL